MNIPHAWSRWGCALLLLLAGDAFAQAPRPAPAPVDSLTLDAARARALADHPGLLAAGLEVDARAAEARQAGRRPNPELGLEVENFGGGGDWSGFGGAEYTLGVAQVIELGGKAGARGEAARLAGVQAGRDVAVRRLDVVLATTRAYLAALTARREVRLAAELVDIAHRDRAEVARRVAAGAVSPLETARADLVERALPRVLVRQVVEE